MNPRRSGEAGFTLIELMISLGLFALIAIAGLALVDGILRVQGRTEVRFDRLADLQRAMFVISSDVDQIARGRISGGGDRFSFTRAAPGFGGPPLALQYSIANGNLVRGSGLQVQTVLSGVTAARWRFWGGAWVARWPVDAEDADAWPRAVEVEMTVAGPGGAPGSLRRVIALPTMPETQP